MKQIVIVGNGMVGYKFCEKLRKASPVEKQEFSVTVYGEELIPAYDRVHLSEYFSDQNADKLSMAPRNWYEENGVRLHTGQLITQIDRSSKKVITHKGMEIPYDYLVLATGSSAFVPPINGVDKKGVFVYRTIEDLDAIIDFGKTVKSAAVMGGGLLGLEAAKAMVDMNLKTHVIEFAPKLMPRQLDERGAQLLKSKIEEIGVSVHLNKNTKNILGNGKLQGLEFTDGDSLDVDMLVISAGIRPRDEVAKSSGLDIGPRGGIMVNDQLQTSDENIYAIGECALHNGMIYGLVAPGYEMADIVVGELMGGSDKSFNDCDMSTKLKLIGVDVASFGDCFGEAEGCKEIVFEDKIAQTYKRVNISADGKKLLGGILVGDAESYNMLHQTAINELPIPESPEELILGARGGEGGASLGVENLPEEALICSCEAVTKGDICSAIVEGDLENVAAVKKCTKAGTGCGGCMPMVTDLFNHTLQSMGKTIKKVVCEHFPYSRQELFDLVKVEGIKTYDELLDKHGTGHGCEICKPVAASIFASAYNEMILQQDTIQDTNDRFLANIQRGGTYSVVPRIPGGEITPDKLIVIGQVAEKYGLYTKITGGQRIDLFGARIDQLPKIWEELIEAGFESGHAYGKALRTVKSCVGSTWCRYGVQDSVSMAVQIENRYKGLRAPHKLKSAVSGCVRECAEAQSKDFGVIATEKGWNLFVCGNGGAKPQHALLLASDIDDETLIKYIDRFLMFYIKTADPLTRTAPWLNKLDGGIEYLKQVVVNDSLGIADRLEADLQALIDKYECEWKKVIESDELKSKFSHFVNDEEPYEDLELVDMRGQKIPAPWK